VVGEISAPIDPLEVTSTVLASADFTDPGKYDTHTAIWDWGDGIASDGIIEETNGSGSVTGNHIYAAAGVYTITLTVTDNYGCSNESVFQYAVIFDPSAGFVTGGGWIDSPEGAYSPDPLLTGKATFGFVSKYKKKSNLPEGNTEFQFKAGDLNFHSTSYDWLVISGYRAKYKGIGAINGAGEYGFMLTAIDEKLTPSTDVDKFRIKIWDKKTEEVVYDNKMGESDDSYETQAISGGSIVIHNEK
jgi:hypothetical protein